MRETRPRPPPTGRSGNTRSRAPRGSSGRSALRAWPSRGRRSPAPASRCADGSARAGTGRTSRSRACRERRERSDTSPRKRAHTESSLRAAPIEEPSQLLPRARRRPRATASGGPKRARDCRGRERPRRRARTPRGRPAAAPPASRSTATSAPWSRRKSSSSRRLAVAMRPRIAREVARTARTAPCRARGRGSRPAARTSATPTSDGAAALARGADLIREDRPRRRARRSLAASWLGRARLA